VKEIFNTPPTQKWEEFIKVLQEQVNQLQKKRSALYDDIEHAEKEHRATLDKLKKYPDLALLEDYIDGKISHYVTHNYCNIRIREFKDIMETNDEYRYSAKKLKLLTLYGRVDGKLAWGLSQYSDGSGSSIEVYPYTSYELALEKAKELVLADFATCSGGNIYHQMIDNAKTFGVPVPEDLMTRYKDKCRKQCYDEIVKSQKDIEAQKKLLNQLEGM
jgi:hypothetical protein